MPQELDPYGNRVVVGNITLTTPGLTGTAESYVPRPGGTRGPDMQAAEMTTAALETAMSEEYLQSQETIEINGTAEIPVSASTRSTAYGEPAIVAEVPDAGEDWGQVLLYTDEAGVTGSGRSRRMTMPRQRQRKSMPRPGPGCRGGALC